MTNSMRNLSAACAMGVAAAFSTAGANDAEAAPLEGQLFVRALTINGDRLELPKCKSRDGATARYVIYDEDPEGSPYAYRIKPGQREYARELRAEGLPHQPGAYIVLSKSFLTMASPEARRHIIAHECAHHILGHTVKPATTEAQAHRGEVEADCAAVKIMSRDFGMSREKIKRALEFFEHPIFQGDGHEIHGNGSTRKQRGLACMLK